MRAALALALVVGMYPGRVAGEEMTWSAVESPVSLDLAAIRFWPLDTGEIGHAGDTAAGPVTGSLTGWIVGEQSTVLRHDGHAWHQIPGPSPAVALDMVVPVGPDEIWASAVDSGHLYHYAHGSWTAHALDSSFSCQGMDFLGPALGYAVGLFGMVYRYDGTLWQRVQAPALASDRESHLQGVAVLAPDDVWIGSPQGGFVLHFDGTAWQRQRIGRGGSIHRTGDTVALMHQRVEVLRDGAWTLLAEEQLYRLALHEGRIWGAGFDGTLVEVMPGRVRERAARLPIRDITTSRAGAWAVGPGGTILTLQRGPTLSFGDSTFEAGVGVLAASTAAAQADLDGRAGADLILFGPFGPNSFLRAEEPGRFRARTLARPALDELPQADALAAADLDGDDRVDLVLRPHGTPGATPLWLLRNLGGWRFLDTPLGAPLQGEDAAPYGSVEIADIDADGDLDVLETRFNDEPGRPVPDWLWRNDGLGRLQPEPLADLGVRRTRDWTRDALLSDVDGDGRLDLVQSNLWARGNALYLQRADGSFADATRAAGLAGAFQETLRTVAGDIDNDGDLDLLAVTSQPYGPSRLYRNDGQGRFRDVTTEAGLGLLRFRHPMFTQCAELADLDNDRDLDLVVCAALPLHGGAVSLRQARLRLLLNDGQGRFSEVTARAGLALPARDAVIDDLDGDGDVDLYVLCEGQANRMLANETRGKRWLKVRLDGLAPNRAGLGAQVRVYGPDGALAGMRETSWRHPVAHFGLGELDVVAVEVRFPTGRTVHLTGVHADRLVTVAEVGLAEGLMHRVVFFGRHRLAWIDRERELAELAVALLVLTLVRWLASRLDAPRVQRAWVAVGLLGLYVGLAFVAAPWAAVSALADLGPLTVTLGVGLALLVHERWRTRRERARFVGPYELLAVIGRGGMGIVHRARDTTRPGKPLVALKVLRPDRIGDPSSLRRFAREAEIGARLQHPGIVAVLASGECSVLEGRVWRRTVYITMELVEGASLAATIAAGERLPLIRILEIVRDAASALGAAHAAGGLHRDVKPDNLLVTRAGVVKLVDFGIALLGRATTETEAGMLVGTLAYLPPERVAGRPEDARSDLYSLGVVLYELVCARRPFDAAEPAVLLADVQSRAPLPPSALGVQLPERLEALILALLAKDPALRPASAAALMVALDEIVQALQGDLLRRTPEPAPEHRAPAATGPATAPASGVASVAQPARIATSAPTPERQTLDMPAPMVTAMDTPMGTTGGAGDDTGQ